ncbi:hypothetical protein F4604DRAFT_756564 [Suillus subluteus]|nr:hypothetical protein F4604DRAFT_756564 [Suillus subluteus]
MQHSAQFCGYTPPSTLVVFVCFIFMVIFDARLTATYLSIAQCLILWLYPSFDPCCLRLLYFRSHLRRTSDYDIVIYSTVLNSVVILLGRAACATLHISVRVPQLLPSSNYLLNPCISADCDSSYRSYLRYSHCCPLTHVLLWL